MLGRIVGCAEFGEERCDGEAALFPFADDFRQFDSGRAREDKLVIENTFCAAGFL